MKPYSKEKLINKFWEGDTSLDEEAFLKNSSFDIKSPENAYFQYINRKPFIEREFQNEIWSKIHSRSTGRNLIIKRLAVAASIAILLTSTAVFSHQYRKAKLQQQFDLLEQALNHVSGELTTTHSSDIVYQDNYIVVVADN